MKKNGFFKAVLLTALFVGTTDLIYAYISVWISAGKFSEKMLNYIAGGALGIQASIADGTPAAFLGLFFHYFIAFSFTLFFFLLFPRLKFLSYNKYLVGMLYGVFVNVFFERLILPITRIPDSPFDLSRSYVNWVIFGLIFGVPIAYNAYKFYLVKEVD